MKTDFSFKSYRLNDTIKNQKNLWHDWVVAIAKEGEKIVY